MTTTAVATVNPAGYRVDIAVITDVAVTAWTLARTYDGITETVRGDGDPWSTFTASGAARTLYDVEGPRGMPVTYVATAVTAAGVADRSPATAAMILEPPAGVDPCWWWIQPVTVPRLAVVFEPDTQTDQTHAAANGVFRAIGRADPIVLFGTRQTPTGDLAARCAGYTDAETLRTATAGPWVLVVRAPPTAGWAPAGRRYIAVDTQTTRRLTQQSVSNYTVDLPWLEVLPPLVPVEGWGTVWTDVPAGFATWTALGSGFTTWDALVGWVP